MPIINREITVQTGGTRLFGAPLKVSNGVLMRSTGGIDLTGAVEIAAPGLSYAYYNNGDATAAFLNTGSLTTISGDCKNTFYGCVGIRGSIDLGHVQTITGDVTSMFESCMQIQSVNLGSLTSLADATCVNMFKNSGVRSVDLHSLTMLGSTATTVGAGKYNSMFYGCFGLESIDLSNLTTILGPSGTQSSSPLRYAFQQCTSLTSFSMPSVITMNGSYLLAHTFNYCSNLTTVTIGGTTNIDFGTKKNQLANMFANCSQNITLNIATTEAILSTFTGYPNFGCTGTLTINYTGA